MMKKLLILLTLLPFGLMAQKKKTQSEVDIVKIKVQNYFKAVYVPLNFKDKYSYQLLKIGAYPVTNKERINELLISITNNIATLDTSSFVSDYKSKLREYYNTKEAHERLYAKADTSTAAVKNSLRYLKYKENEANTALAAYNKAIEDKNTLTQSLQKLPVAELNKLICYRVYLDCYANNSYGNKVLGEYVILTDRQGKFIEEPRKINQE